MNKYLDYFGIYKKIDFAGKDLDFVKNTLDFMNIKSVYHNDEIGEHNDLILNLLNNNIEIYEFDFKEVNNPEGRTEENIYCSLMNISKGVSGWRTWIYWRAYKFFKERGLYICPVSGVSNYFTLKSKESLNYLNPEDNSSKIAEQEVINIVSNYNTKIRCGEIDSYRILLELTNQDFLWIFPYIEDENSLKCYVLKAKEQFKSMRNEFMSKEFDKIKDCFNLID